MGGRWALARFPSRSYERSSLRPQSTNQALISIRITPSCTAPTIFSPGFCHVVSGSTGRTSYRYRLDQVPERCGDTNRGINSCRIRTSRFLPKLRPNNAIVNSQGNFFILSARYEIQSSKVRLLVEVGVDLTELGRVENALRNENHVSWALDRDIETMCGLENWYDLEILEPKMGASPEDFYIEFKVIFVSEGELLEDFWKLVEDSTVLDCAIPGAWTDD